MVTQAATVVDKEVVYKEDYLYISLIGKEEIIRLPATPSEYKRYNVGSTLKFTIKKGALGSKWIQKIE